MFWVVTFYVLMLIVGSGLGLLTGKWQHFQFAAVGGLVLLTVWWVVSKLRAR